MRDSITKSEAAKRLGVSPSAITRAVQGGRLEATKDGKIPLDAIDEYKVRPQFAAQANARKVRSEGTAERLRERAAIAVSKAASSVDSDESEPDYNYNESRAKREHFAAEKERIEAERARIKLETERGALLVKEDVDRDFATLGRSTRDQVMAVVARVSAEISILDDEDEISTRLTKELTDALEEAARVAEAMVTQKHKVDMDS